MFNLTSILFYAHVVLGFCFINFAFTSKDLTDESSENFTVFLQGSIVYGNSVRLIEGQDLNLSCIYTKNSSFTTLWETEDKGVQHNPYIVPGIDKSNKGLYVCTLNDSTDLVRIISVEVLYPPNQPKVAGPVSVPKGKTVNLTCSTDANPSATFSWRKDTSFYAPVISTGPTITLNVDKETIVYCTAKNTMRPTNGHLVEKFASASHRITVKDSPDSSEKDDLFNFLKDATTGWIVAASLLVLLALVLILYCRKRNTSQRSHKAGEQKDQTSVTNRQTKENQGGRKIEESNNNLSRDYQRGYVETPSLTKMELSADQTKRPSDICLHPVVKLPNESKPKLSKREKHPSRSSLDKQPLHSYIELEIQEDTSLHGIDNISSEVVYDEPVVDVINNQGNALNGNPLESDVRNTERIPQDSSGYLVPIGGVSSKRI